MKDIFDFHLVHARYGDIHVTYKLSLNAKALEQRIILNKGTEAFDRFKSISSGRVIHPKKVIQILKEEWVFKNSDRYPNIFRPVYRKVLPIIKTHEDVRIRK